MMQQQLIQPQQQPIPAQQTQASSSMPTQATTPTLLNALVPIANSTTTVAKIPKVHLLQLLQHLEPQLDGTLTGHLEPDVLLIVFWMLCHMPPPFVLLNLQARLYGQLADAAKVAAARVKDRGGEENKLCITEMCCATDIQ